MTRLELLADAPLAVQIHLATIVPAFFIGTWQIFASTKGSVIHRRLGYAYMALMLVTATAAMFIRSLDGGLTPIHLFVPVTFVSVTVAFVAIRRGAVAAPTAGR